MISFIYWYYLSCQLHTSFESNQYVSLLFLLLFLFCEGFRMMTIEEAIPPLPPGLGIQISWLATLLLLLLLLAIITWTLGKWSLVSFLILITLITCTTHPPSGKISHLQNNSALLNVKINLNVYFSYIDFVYYHCLWCGRVCDHKAFLKFVGSSESFLFSTKWNE